MAEGIAFEVADGVTVAWDDLTRTRSDLLAGETSAQWRLEGDPGPGHTALRVLTGATDKGSMVLLAAARPSDSDGHDAESPRAVLVSGSGGVRPIDEALVSTQYAANGLVERVGLELYAEGDDYPVRGAGDVTGLAAGDEQGRRREQAFFDFRLDGERGAAVLDIVHL